MLNRFKKSFTRYPARRLPRLLYAFILATPGAALLAATNESPIIADQPDRGARAGALFEHELSAAGTPDYFSAAGLPAGITLDSQTGLISGVAGVGPATYDTVVGATNAHGASTPKPLRIHVYPEEGEAPIVSGEPVVSVPADAPLQIDFGVSHLDIETVVEVEGLPEGVTFDAESFDQASFTPDIDPSERVFGLRIEGMVTTPGIYPFQVSVTNLYGTTERTFRVAASRPIWDHRELFDEHIVSVAYGNGRFAALIANGEIYTSEDGVEWTLRLDEGSGEPNEIVFTNNRFIAFGNERRSGPGEIFTSSDGVIWSGPESSSGINWTSAAYGNGVYVVAGGEHTTNVPAVAVSEEGETWSVSTPETFPGRLLGMIFDGDHFIAIGQNGEVGRSADGIEWSLIGRTFISDFQHLAYGNARFVAADRRSEIHVSDDGVTWTRTEVNMGPHATSAIEFVQDRFLLGGEGGTVKESFDGVNWADRTPHGADLPVVRGFAFDGDTLIAGANHGNAFFSDSPRQWPPAAVEGRHHTVRSGVWSEFQVPITGVFDRVRGFDLPSGLSLDENTGLLSGTLSEADDSTITLVPEFAGEPGKPESLVVRVRPESGEPPVINVPRTLMVDPGERHVRLIETEGLDPDSVLEILGPPEGVSAEISPMAVRWHSLEDSAEVVTVRAENVYGTTEEEILVVSERPHETEWRPVEDVIPSVGISVGLNALIHAGGRFVAVGGSRSTGFATVSEDGETWTDTLVSDTVRLRDVAYGNGLFVAIEEAGRIFSSSDGLQWTQRADFENDFGFQGSLLALIFTGESFLAAGSDGFVVISGDGMDWEVRDTDVSVTFFELAFGDGSFAALTGSPTNATIYISDDATNWIPVPESDLDSILRGIGYGNGRFVTSGAVSIDGAHWFTDLRAHEWGLSPQIAKVVFHDGYFMATGVGRVSYSVDGYIWGARTQNGPSSFNGITSDGGKTIAVADRPDVFVQEAGPPVLIGPGKPLANVGSPYDLDSVFGEATASAVRVATAGEAFQLPMITSGQPDSFLAAGLPEGLSFDLATGTLSGVPEQAGVYRIGVGATHEMGLPEPIVIELHVRPEAGEPPRLTSADTVETQRWSDFSYEIALEGADPTTEIVAVELPRGLRLDPIRRTISGELLDGGTQTIVLTLSNTHGIRTETIWVDSITPNLQRRVSGVETHLNAVAHGDGVFVAVGDNNVILTTEHGDEWTQRESPISAETSSSDFLGVVHGPAGFVALSDHYSQRLISSPDGVEWESAPSDSLISQARHIAVGHDLYVMGGESGRIFVSANGKDWTEVETPVTDTMANLSFAGGYFLVSLPFQNFLASTDGLKWEVVEDVEGIFGTLARVAFGDGRFVGIRPSSRMLFTGENIDRWERLSDPPEELRDVVFAGDQFLAAGGSGDTGLVWTSPDGLVWHERTAADPLDAVAWGNGRFVGIGRNGRIGISEGHWPPTIMDRPYAFGEIGVAFEHSITAGYHPEFYSAGPLPPGIEFDETNGVLFGTPEQSGTYDVTITAANAAGVSEPFQLTVVIYSADGEPPVPEETLTPRIADLGEEFEYRIPFDVTSTPTQVSVEGLPDGLTFDPGTGMVSGTPQDEGTHQLVIRAENFFGETEIDTVLQVFLSPFMPVESHVDDNILGLAYGNGVYVAVGRLWNWGEPNSILHSTNGIDWTVEPFSVVSEGYLRDVTFGGGVFVAVGESGEVFYSEDGAEWDAATGKPDSDTHLYAVAYGSGTFVAVGIDGAVVSSDDGNVWSTVASPTEEDLRTVALAGNRVVIGGRNGTLFTSNDMIEWTKHTSFSRDEGIGIFGGTLTGAWADSERFLSMDNGGNVFLYPHAEESWRRVRDGEGGNALFSATHTGYEFRIVGGGGTVLVSQDGESWSDVSDEAGIRGEPTWGESPPRLEAIVTGDDLVVTAGSNGSLFAGLPRWQPHFTGAPAAVARAGETFEYMIETDQPLDTATAKSIPPGLEIDTQTGVISGVFSEPGMWALEVAGSNAFGWTGWIEVEIEVLPSDGPLPRLASSGFLAGAYAEPLEHQLVVEYSDLTTEVSLEGLPAGVLFDPAEGVISGIPEDSGTFVMTVLMSNIYGTSSQEIELYIAPPDWEPIEFSENETLTGVAFGNETYIAVDDAGKVFRSVDGTGWQETTPTGHEEAFRDVRFLNGAFQAVGDNGTLLSSEFGTSWTIRDTDVTETLTGITFGNGIYVAVGYGGSVVRSSDGETWNSVILANEPYLGSVAFGLPGFVATDSSIGMVYFSADGEVWTSHSLPFEVMSVTDLSYIDDRFIGAGRLITGGGLVSSFDGTNWEVSPETFPDSVRGIAQNDRFVIVVGEDGFTASQENAGEWSSLVSGVKETLNAVTHGDSGFVAVGGNGAVLKLPLLRRPQIQHFPPAIGEVGVEYAYSIIASGEVDRFHADGLPDGLAIDPITGLITGKPERSGTYIVRIQAENQSGRVAEILELEIAGTPPVIVQQPESHTVEVGETAAFTVTFDGEPAPEFQWYKNGTPLIGGESVEGTQSPDLFISNAQIHDSGTYTVSLSNTYGETESNPVQLRVGRSYQNWAEYHGLPEELGAPEDDPSGRGIPNLLAYFLGIDPLAPLHEHPIGFEVEGNTLIFTFTRNKAAIDIQWEVEVTEDLVEWRPTTIPPVLSSETQTTERWELIKPITENPIFVRIRVTKSINPLN